VSDYQDFCESFGGCASDPDFMDKWMDEYLADEAPVKSKRSPINDTLPKGKLVHIIKLLATYPAKPMGIIWNKELPRALPCNGSNHLISTDHDDPASWFVRKGFTVRSSRANGYWYQIAFKSNHSDTYLKENELKDYESICSTLNPDWVRNIRN